ncbi:hypothetical protein JYG34_01240 [Pseudomonas entomophila]|uniref:hypothetical protein n=1 Tax=Pseudomonas entomophila TaxID=312306 RepID=UPI001BCE12DE|nr:hypothetical protein [Pseudomonas entomophila]QVM91691.1 hypothetical protein JYG34_01240 [Pseudomonas entomophila]
MSLKLTSSEHFFNAYIEQFQGDGVITPVESIQIRKSADTEIEVLIDSLKTHVNEVLKKEQKPELDWPLRRLQMTCDILVEDLQFLAKLMRNASLDEETIGQIRSAVEHQLTYVVFANNSSVARVKALKKSL